MTAPVCEEIDTILDQTSEQKPYRFWLNNDDDRGYDSDGDTIIEDDTYVAKRDNPWSPGKLDNADDKIIQVRDLDDFARLHFRVESIHSELAAGTMTLGFKWKTVHSGAPKIRLFRAADSDGGTKYLSDETTADNQVVIGASAIGVVEGTSILDISVSFWSSSTSSATTRYLIFEGLEEGKGELTLVLKQGSSVLAEGESAFLEILDIRKMYELWGIDPTAVIPDPDTDAAMTVSGVTAIKYSGSNFFYPSFIPAWDEDLQNKNYVVCVHGWRKGGVAAAAPDLYFKGRSDEITMYKRQWHRGFKGRYIGFIWPTYDAELVDSSGNYDAFESAKQSKFGWSEYRAWKCGEAFKTMLDGLPTDYKKKVFAHSLGNVLVGSALEKGAAIDNYALINAAIPAYCYDQAAPLTLQALAEDVFFHDDFSFDPSASVRNLSYRGDVNALGHARLENVSSSITNFYNPNDNALGLVGWIAHQVGAPLINGKPIGSYEYEKMLVGDNEIQWDPAGTVKRLVADPHEAMSMVNNSWSNSLGRTPSIGGKIQVAKNINMSDPAGDINFNDEHEAVFKWQPAKTWKFYEKLWTSLDLPNPIAP